jgi:DNA-binding response OmpR family regulator
MGETRHAKGKPFSYPELRGRVVALLRRTNGRRGLGRLRLGDLEVDCRPATTSGWVSMTITFTARGS